MTDPLAVKFRPTALVEAARQVRTGPRVMEGVLAVGPAAVATGETVSAFLEWARGRTEVSEPELSRRVREALPDVDGRSVRDAIDTLRLRDEGAVQEVADRLARDLAGAYADRDDEVRAARVRAVLERERGVVEELEATAEPRAIELAEEAWIWAGTP